MASYTPNVKEIPRLLWLSALTNRVEVTTKSGTVRSLNGGFR
jgi:hypothetical protein